MKVINTTESDRRLADGTRAVRGKPVEVDDVLGADLVDQGWVEASTVVDTVADVLAEVGDDPVKAAAALAVEEGQANPRPTLTKKLAAIAAADTDTEGA
ncbi:MAG: hypothetical protein KA755_14310 [Candidatus Microthrix sp.]|jgi:hypothetical protein|nr:hypothetical protein [Candidatus Microthrix sp.]